MASNYVSVDQVADLMDEVVAAVAAKFGLDAATLVADLWSAHCDRGQQDCGGDEADTFPAGVLAELNRQMGQASARLNRQARRAARPRLAVK